MWQHYLHIVEFWYDTVNNMIRFLYEQRTEFGKVNEKLRILKGLHKCVKLHIVKNLKQLNLHNFYDNIAE
jgi:hypothetical protein